ncbi:EAL domain-containing protein [Massilia sp. LXY-6]|uniref:EAL domain-containing protein n=1 Tax=Massilia sp. LXY-6 TaxID=3379823 RepID=UPI003EE1B475
MHLFFSLELPIAMPQQYKPIIGSFWTTDACGASTMAEHVPGVLPPMGEVLFLEWLCSTHPTDGLSAAEAIAGAMARREPFRHEHRMVCTDDCTRWVITTGRPRFGESGEFDGFTGAIVDVTEQTSCLEQARRSEEEFRSILDTSTDLIAYCGSDGRYIHVSSSYTRVLGWKGTEMIGQFPSAFLHPDDQAGAREMFTGMVGGEHMPDVLEVRKRQRNGEYIALGTKICKVTEPVTGAVIGAVLVSRDIRREKEMLTRLERMAEQNSALIENSPDIIMLLDLEGNILHVNKVLQQTLGYQPEELIGRDAMNYVSPEGRAGATHDLMTLAHEEGYLSSNVPCLRKDGRALQLDWSLRRPSGSDLIYATARDVTEKHLTQLALQEAHAHVRAILESIDDGFFSVNAKWEITYANTLAAAFVGLGRDEPINKVLWDVAEGLGESPAAAIYRRAMDRRENTSFDIFYEPAGAWISTRIYARDDGLSVFFHDISERVRRDLAVHDSEKRLREMIAITPAGYVLTSADGIIQEVNPALCQLSGYARDELIGTSIIDILFSEDRNMALHIGQSGNQDHAIETTLRHKQGRTMHVLVNQTITRDDRGELLSLSAFVTDITERKHTEARLEQLATRDALTGLPNRAWLNQHLKGMLAAAPDQVATTVLFIDLNRFKEVNDSMGHAAGDHLLQQVSQRLQSCMRPGDVVARLGGDEFVVAANCQGRDAAAAIAQRLLTALTVPFQLDRLEICVGASIGISLSDHEISSPELLFQNADTAMYRAKAAGDNTYQFFEPAMSVEVKRTLQLEMALRRALELGQFELHYQPRIDLRTMQTRGMEALLRWNHPEFGQVPPLHFIPIAEERGHIAAIGTWVLHEACREAKRIREKYGVTLQVSVNVSARQLHGTDLIAEVGHALQASGLPPDALELELTESALIDDTEHSADVLRRLKRLGITLSLDDFGTGYSSLSYLKRFPVDVLKLDRSFLDEQSFDNGNREFVKAVIDMAHALGLVVVAEGIETEEVMETLRQAACNEGQGYLFSRPLPLKEFDRFLQCELKGATIR